MRQFLCSKLIGRAEEVDVLRAARTRAKQRNGGLVIVTGEAGVGKSRVVRAAADEAADEGFLVLRGRASPSPTPAPFRPLAEALLSRLRNTGPPQSEELSPYRGYLGRLVPEWGLPAPAEQSLVLVGEAVLRLLRVLAADHGCLLVLEDLHWADPETLAILDYLADNLSGEPVSCVATARPEGTSPGTAFVRSVHRRRAASLVELEPLGREETEQMAAACLEVREFPSSLRHALLTSAEGNPFLVEELVAAWTGDGVLVEDAAGWVVAGPVQRVVPLSFAEMARSRMSKLDPEERHVLAAASVLGRRFDWSLLAPMLSADHHLVLGALRAGVEAQLIQPLADEDAEFRFRHALTRDAILADLLPPEAEAMARRALEVIQQRGSDSPDVQALTAELAERAGDRAQAAGLLLGLGRMALGRAALDTAEAALVRARELAADHRDMWLDILEALIEVYSASGRLPQALEAGDALLNAVPATHPRAVTVHLRLARAAVVAEHWDVALGHLDKGRSVDEPATQARADGLAALVAIGHRSPSVAEDLARSALERASSIGLPDVECTAWQVLGRCARISDLGRAKEYFDRAVQVAVDHELSLQRIEALHERSTIDLLDSNAVGGLEEVRDLAVRAGAMSLAAVLDVQVAGALYARWQPERLAEVAQRAAAGARVLNLPLVRSMALLWQAASYCQKGDGPMMESLIEEALHDAEPDAEAMSLGWCRAVFALLNDERAEAMARLDAAEGLLVDHEGANPWGFRGLWCLMRTVEDTGAKQAQEQLRKSGATVWWMNRAWLDVCEAVVAGRDGDNRVADDAFRRGDEALAPSPWFRQLTRVLVAESAATAGWGEPAAWLRSAGDFFARSGHVRLRLSCRTLLRKLGEPVPRRGRGEAAVPAELLSLGVTSREVDVLWLVADGLGNRDIATRLFLSHRTVEKHVASLVAKTGVPGRSELASLASRLHP